MTDHAIKELCRLYIAKSVECQYCGGQRSMLAREQGPAGGTRPIPPVPPLRYE